MNTKLNIHLPPVSGTLAGLKNSTQRGVVLVMAMILLIVISLLAVTSMRNVASTESISGNVRTTEMATQAAEMALRYCESSLVQLVGGVTSTFTTTFVTGNILPASANPSWTNLSNWDTAGTTMTFVLPTAVVPASANYKRRPECMVEPILSVATGSTTVNSTSSFVITARGFGPEVAAGTGRPNGSEVWLQSHIELQ
jgi:type IV pilus assembly protein PilX